VPRLAEQRDRHTLAAGEATRDRERHRMTLVDGLPVTKEDQRQRSRVTLWGRQHPLHSAAPEVEHKSSVEHAMLGACVVGPVQSQWAS
jgi:hypothetical protein